MKVQNIQTQNFEAKKRFITPKTKEGIKFLLTRMNAETEYIKNTNTFKSMILMRLKYGEKVSFIDNRVYIAPVDSDKQMNHKSILQIGRREYTIDNNTGEILNAKKGLFSTWKSVINKIEKYVTLFKENYFDENQISKSYLTIKDFTEQGIAKLKA